MKKMKKTKKERMKVLSLSVVMLLLLSIVAAPVMAYEPTKPYDSSTTISDCADCKDSYVAVGHEDIAKSRDAGEALGIVMDSEELHEISLNLTKQGYLVMSDKPIVIVNTSTNTARVFFEAIPIHDNLSDASKAAMFVVDLEEGKVIEAYWIDWCAVACAVAAAACGIGCSAACCYAVPPLCEICITICTLACEQGYEACYDWCTGQ